MNVHIATRVAPQTRDRLAEHAGDTARTLGAEMRCWLEVGASMAFYSGAIDPRAEGLLGLTPQELEQLREQARAEMLKAIDRALPGRMVSPEVLVQAMTPSVSFN